VPAGLSPALHAYHEELRDFMPAPLVTDCAIS
jgi:hypothetical protein